MERILFISQKIPYPPNKGCKIRSYNEILFLHDRYEIDMVTLYDGREEIQYIRKLTKYCGYLHYFHINKFFSFIKGLFFLLIGKSFSEGYYHSKKVKKLIHKLVKGSNYKFVFCFSSRVAQYVMNLNVYRIMDFCDVDSDKFSQYSLKSFFPMNFFYKLESKRLSEFEIKIYKKFNNSIFATQKECERFGRGAPGTKIHVMGNGVDLRYFNPQKVKKENSLIFTGDMSYYANVEGVIWFCKEIFPTILKVVPDLKFYIVGRDPTKEVRNLENNNVTVTGAVSDIRNFIAKSKMAVIPLRTARGIQNMVLEAMAMAVPVVISESLYSSLENIEKDDILIYNSSESLIEIITSLIDRPILLQKRGNKHRQYAVDNLNWNSVFENSSVWNGLLKKGYNKTL